MNISARTLKATISASIIAAAFATTAAPAYANGGSYKDLTCTSSTGYSVLVQGSAKGQTYHQVDEAYYWYKGTFSSYTFKATNTGMGGTHLAWVKGFDTSSIVGGVSSNTSKCSTY